MTDALIKYLVDKLTDWLFVFFGISLVLWFGMSLPIFINNLIREVVELYRINQSHAKIVLDLQDSPIIHADSDRLRQLLINLIKNAHEAMQLNDDVQAVLTLTTQIEHINDSVRQFLLVVSDTGPGISDDLLPYLFEPYRTTKTKGTGLGLAIVKRIVDEHDGRVTAQNNQTLGASISIYFPISNV